MSDLVGDVIGLTLVGLMPAMLAGVLGGDSYHHPFAWAPAIAIFAVWAAVWTALLLTVGIS